ncbi:MAG: glycosyltransferase [Chromatiales bacterium]|nr:glycosyltransferase [Chromatiales bacterium]
MRIVFVIATLDAGGAERVATTLTRHWSAAGRDVHLVTFESPDAVSHYRVGPGVEVHRLDLLRAQGAGGGSLGAIIGRTVALTRCLRRLTPDVVVSFIAETNVLAVLACRWLRVPVVVSERIHPAHYPASRLRARIRDLVYRLADRVVVQTDDIAAWFAARGSRRVTVLPNPVELAEPRPRPPPRAERGRIVAIGRLAPQKAHDVLVEAFARIAPEHPGWSLAIYGEGPLRTALSARIAALGVGDSVTLAGLTDDVPGVLATADLFVHCSRFEGAPNVLIEALAAGCCCVATDAPGASGDLLDGGRLGVLVPPDDPPALATALSALIDDPARRARCAAGAREGVAHLEAGAVSGRWLAVVEAAAGRS